MITNDKESLTGLIEVLTWLRGKCGNVRFPTHCEHDTLILCGGYSTDELTSDEIQWLDARGFIVSDEFDAALVSYHFGAA